MFEDLLNCQMPNAKANTMEHRVHAARQRSAWRFKLQGVQICICKWPILADGAFSGCVADVVPL